MCMKTAKLEKHPAACQALRLFILACILCGLISALSPVADIDQDGFSDSLVTEGEVYLSLLSGIAGEALASRFFLVFNTPARVSLSPLLPPPIFSS